MDFRWTLNSPGRGIPVRLVLGALDRIADRSSDPASDVSAIEGNDGYRLYLGGRLLIDNWKKQSYGTRIAAVDLKPGSSSDIRLEYFESTGNARLKLLWDAGVADDSQERIAEAVALASQSDATVIVAGLEEGEFRDRAFLGLPGRQEELILRVAATGKPVVVVLVGGSAITMSRWLDRVERGHRRMVSGRGGRPRGGGRASSATTIPRGACRSRFRCRKGNFRSITITSRQAAATTTSISRDSRCSRSASV